MENDHYKSAFPSNESNYLKDYSDPGMSLRDYFAAKAMASIVRRWDGHSFGGGPESPQYKELAEDAYHIADAMLRAREAVMTVTHNGKQYRARQVTGNVWRLTSVDNPRDKVTLNRQQMAYAGLLEQVEKQS